MTTWSQHLAGYTTVTATNLNGEALFGAEFLCRWGNEAWPPYNPVANADDITAAARLHVQLISRITTQRLPYVDGVEAAALKSVYELFGEARSIFKALSKCRLTETLSWHVLNTHVRPFTAKWHRQYERGALAALDATDIFRNELFALQRILTRFDDLLVEIRDGTAPPVAPAVQESERETKIAAEMNRPVARGIDRLLGGLPPCTADLINGAEDAAITARRLHYGPLPQPHRPHAVALAISGGGIRSATFALGVLVALARRNLMYQFDYLSTVSGGGYIGSFLTSFLNGDDPPLPVPTAPQVAAPAVAIGLRGDQLPFRRTDGEASAVRHVRHHSKYLATGRLWERLQMACAQVYGMVMNGVGFAYVAILAATLEYVCRLWLPPGSFWPLPILVVMAILAVISVLLPPFIRWLDWVRKNADAMLAWPTLGLLTLLAWHGLEWAHEGFLLTAHRGWGGGVIGLAAVPLFASAVLALAGNLWLPVRILLIVLSTIAAPLLFLEIELAAYAVIVGQIALGPVTLPVLGTLSSDAIGNIVLLAGLILWIFLDINFTAPHRHYRKKLGEAYLVQLDPAKKKGALNANVSLLLSQGTKKNRAPYHLVNGALNVPASQNPAMQGRLTDFFLFSPAFCGSPLTGYEPTQRWEELDGSLDLGTAMAISGGAAAPQMGTGTIRNASFWLALFNARLGYWVRNPRKDGSRRGAPPGLVYLLQEMFGRAQENRPYLNVSDGGHIENLGVYELLRRRCKYIVAIDGEQDPKMTFHGLTTLQRLAAIDLGVTIDIGVDDLRLGEKGLSHSHFTFCRIKYPEGSREGPASYGYLIYLKLSLTGNEGEFIRRYRLDEPDFPHHSTADQFFTEAQFEAYRSLGEHVGDKMFLPAIVGPDLPKENIMVEDWFKAIGKNMLDPLART